MRLTETICRDRAACLLEAAEHLNVAWGGCGDIEPAPSTREIQWAYGWLMKQVDKWEVKAESFSEV